MRTLASLLFAHTALVLMAPSAGAVSRDLGADGGRTLVTDGRGYVATFAGTGQVRVLNLRSGERRTVDVQPGCYGQGLSAGKLVVSCAYSPDPDVDGTGYTLDLRTGARVDLPALTRAAFGSGIQGNYGETYLAVGRHWAEIDQADYHSVTLRYLNLTTGAVIDEPGLGFVADLDAPSGVRRLCAPLRRPSVPNPVFLGLVAGKLLQAGRYAAGVYYREDARGGQSSRVELTRCGSPPEVVRRCVSVDCSQLALDRRTLAWVETRGKPQTSEIVIRSLRTGTTRRIARTGRVQMQLARGDLYVLADGRLRRITP